MREPMTMLDWGMYQMSEDLREGMKDRLDRLGVTAPPNTISSSVRYDFARDLIEVWMLLLPTATFRQAPKELCRQTVNFLGTDLGFPAGQDVGPPIWTSYFVPNGYTVNEKADKTLSQSLPKLVTIKVTLYKEMKKTECTGLLTEKTVSFAE